MRSNWYPTEDPRIFADAAHATDEDTVPGVFALEHTDAFVERRAANKSRVEQLREASRTRRNHLAEHRAKALRIVAELRALSHGQLDDRLGERLIAPIAAQCAEGPVTIRTILDAPGVEGLIDALKRDSTVTVADLELILELCDLAGRRLEIPALVPWCDLAAYQQQRRRFREQGSNCSQDDKKYLQDLEAIGKHRLHPARHPAALPGIREILALSGQFPNFTEPLRYIAEQAAVCRLGEGRPFKPAPMLLVGSPGIGKTRLAGALAKLLGSRVETISLSSASAGFALAGLDRGWATARAGMVFDAIAKGDSLAPIFILDEIDKVCTESRSNPLGALYQLLESHTARTFRDEYAEFAIDASHVIWLATANQVDAIPTPLLNRFRVFHIADPTPEQMQCIAASLYAELAGDLPAPREIPDAWRRRINGGSIRSLRQALQEALGKAAVRAALADARGLELLPEDFPATLEKSPHRRMGFLN